MGVFNTMKWVEWHLRAWVESSVTLTHVSSLTGCSHTAWGVQHERLWQLEAVLRATTAWSCLPAGTTAAWETRLPSWSRKTSATSYRWERIGPTWDGGQDCGGSFLLGHLIWVNCFQVSLCSLSLLSGGSGGGPVKEKGSFSDIASKNTFILSTQSYVSTCKRVHYSSTLRHLWGHKLQPGKWCNGKAMTQLGSLIQSF